MKKIVIVLALISSFNAVRAQDEERDSDEKKAHLKKKTFSLVEALSFQ